MKREYGLDRPLPVQYLVWLGKLLTGDLGISIQTGRAVSAELGPALPEPHPSWSGWLETEWERRHAAGR
jgi:ABC-type dipeptide/oligopeptide/nickel transport system permease component